MRYASVVVDIAHSQVDKIFDYALGAEFGHVGVGWRVMVPFGHSRTEGFVVGLKDTTEVPAHKIKFIQSLPEDYAALLPEMVELAFWMKKRYHCLLVDALRVMMPAELRTGRAHDQMEKYILPACSPEELGRAMAAMTRAPKQVAALNVLLALGGGAQSALNEAGNCDSAIWRALEKKGLVRIEEQLAGRRPLASQDIQRDEPFSPTPHQAMAIERINSALGRGGEFLLHGVTGCGKTEVYMQCAAKALSLGQDVIILVPEISLTPQMVRRFTARFGDDSAVLHSRLSAGERHDEWQRIRRGQAHVVVGARSAIFAPMANLGLVVIDEEHESSYRSEHTPRYDALEVARRRCKESHAPLVLGSATPSLTSYYRAQRHETELIEMPSRIGTAQLPPIQIVDLKEELAGGNRGVISAPLAHALNECIDSGGQAILFLNRRGHSSFVSCRTCSYVVRCPLCDVSMTYHKADGRMHCHYCGEQAPLPAVCPECGSKYIRFFGDGTQKLEEELARDFPRARTLRMDADTTKGKDSHLVLLDQFRTGQANVLIGTQMIAKGLDFPNVTLVGVVAADGMLFLPDYKSTERAFQLMAQVAGRAGRSSRPGRVMIQTYAPEHYAVKCAAAHDYLGFYTQELELRRLSQYPPFGRILRVLLMHEDRDTACADIETLLSKVKAALLLAPELAEAVIFLEATEAPVARIQARYRYHLVLKCAEDERADALENLLAAAIVDLPGDSHPILESNPPSML